MCLYRGYQWSLANKVPTDARRTLNPNLSAVGKFVLSLLVRLRWWRQE
jgi:hypothetical protein